MKKSWLCLASGIAGSAVLSLSLAAEPYPSTYRAAPSGPTLIRGATVLTGTGTRIDDADVLMVKGRIEAVGPGLQAPTDARVIDAKGHWVTPGLIDVHSHLGVYPNPSTLANSDGNENTDPVTPNVWVEHSIWPQDPNFEAALEGGVTTMQILPGSTNLIGGRSVVVKNVAAVSYQDMKFPGAPYGMKMACGENPKSNYGAKGQAPASRMGNVAGYRQAFLDAQEYQRQWEKYERDLAQYQKEQAEKAKKKGGRQYAQADEATKAGRQNVRADKAEKAGRQETKGSGKDAGPPSPPKRDLKEDTLVGVLKGEILVHIHCYRADEMATMLDLADEFGFRIAAFHHGVEAYKIADRLADKGVCGALWADWWGFKMEAFDGIQENLVLVDRPANGCAIVHSDSSEGIQRLNQEAAKAMSRGIRMGLAIPPERAIRWLTSNPAKSLGLGDRVGTLEPGRMADVVIWNQNPFSVYALAEQVFIDGAMAFDREHPQAKPRSDFMLGQPVEGASP